MIERGISRNKYHAAEKDKREFIVETLVKMAKDCLGLDREHAILRIKEYMGIDITKGDINDAK